MEGGNKKLMEGKREQKENSLDKQKHNKIVYKFTDSEGSQRTAQNQRLEKENQGKRAKEGSSIYSQMI